VKSKYSSLFAVQILRVPFTCDPQHYPSELPERANVPIFNDAALAAMLGAFVPNKSDRTTHFVSPLLAKPELIKELPPTYIDVCSADPLCVPAIA
jgi:acetyl esterase/lipase